MSKPICRNFTELAVYLRDIDPSVATSIAKSILERVDIPELREFIAPQWEDVTAKIRFKEAGGSQYLGIEGVDFERPFRLIVNPLSNPDTLSKYKFDSGRIWRRREV